MKIIVGAVGRLKGKQAQELQQEYFGRLKHYTPSELLVVRDESQLLNQLKASDILVALDERGKSLTSKGLSLFLEEHQHRASRRVIFFIGGADGHSDELRARADTLLSLSSLTFPHEIAQILLCEQLYRAFTILKGEPYHREG